MMCEDDEGKCFSPMLVGMAHDGCVQRSVESFYESVGGKVISGRAGKLDTT
jgi:hypothetical protein